MNALAVERAAAPPVFRAEGITKVYRMGEVEVHALRGVDLKLPESELVVLLGPSGSGKSTLLNILGGLGAIPRALQTSHWYLANELEQLQNVGGFLPMIFLAVAAFLLNVVLTRVVSVQREQIAALKALGYSNGALALHYSKLGLAIALFGTALAAAALGALGAVRRVVSLPPAEAMRPEAPASYRETLLERLGLRRILPAPWRSFPWTAAGPP